MHKPLQSLLEKIYTAFKKDSGKIIIYTGVIATALSSCAQIFALKVNKNIKEDKKPFLVSQEIWDMCFNIGTFLLITTGSKKLISKMYSTGKLAPKSVRNFINQHKELKDSVGKIDFDLGAKMDEYIKLGKECPKQEYTVNKNFGTTVATVLGGIMAQNIVTPIYRNKEATKAYKVYLKKQEMLQKPDENTSPNWKNKSLAQYNISPVISPVNNMKI